MLSDAMMLEKINEANKFIDKTYFKDLHEYHAKEIEDYKKKYNLSRLYKINKIIYDKDEDINEKMISVLCAIIPFSKNLTFLIRGRKDGVELFIGVKANQISEAQISAEVLHDAFIGNFPGSDLELLKSKEIPLIFNDDTENNNTYNIAYINIIPSERKTEKGSYIQGLEKFIDTMRGSEYICEIIASPIKENEVNEKLCGFEELYSALYPFSKKTSSHGHNEGKSLTDGINESISDSISSGISRAVGRTDGHSNGTNKSMNMGLHMLLNLGISSGTNEGWTTGSNETDSFSNNKTRTDSYGHNKSISESVGTTDNLTIEFKNKGIEELLEKIETHIKRLKTGNSFGIWEIGSYFMSEDKKTAAVAASMYRALLLGEDTGIEKSNFILFDEVEDKTKIIQENLEYFEHPMFLLPDKSLDKNIRIVALTSYINGRELVRLISLPRKSVNGVMVSEIAEFGRNTPSLSYKIQRTIDVGNILHMGVESNQRVKLDIDNFSSHCFVTGSTGSGKSNTIYNIIEELSDEANYNIPFLVIEPAKGEYRNRFRKMKGINLFSTNPMIDQMLKLNPFSFGEGIHILEHLDRVIEIFNGCWEMYAAMPAILKASIEQAYISKGWDLLNSLYMNGGMVQFPTFYDVLSELPKVIGNSEYSTETKGDYIGALVTRVNSMTNGIYGQIFCDDYEIDNQTLFDDKTIIDLSRIGSSETKSLIIGILILKLTEYRMENAHGTDAELKHITILEEAHNILKNEKNTFNNTGNKVVAKSVEMLVNSIAEMRTYGEGFIIVDQSPTSVDIAAIKNTNTKIIMRLPEEDDRNVVGKSVSLKENQIIELSKLKTGVAVVMQNDWQEPVLVQINQAKNKYVLQEKPTDRGKLKQFKSMIVTELINEYQYTDNRNVNKILQQIDVFDIEEAKKTEARRLIKKFDSVINYKFSSLYFGRTIMRLIGCSDAFKRAERVLRREKSEEGESMSAYSEDSVISWQNMVQTDIQNYIDVDRQYQNIIKKYIIYYLTHDKHDVDYGVLYQQIYSKVK